LRGLPGSGKSTLSKHIVSKYPHAVHCSADDFLYENGRYVWTKERIKIAHESNQEKARQACKRSEHIVVIDNTNVKYWEMKPYLEIASAHNYSVVLVEPRTPWKFIPAELMNRSAHTVPLKIIESRLSDWNDIVPLYYGWFLNEADSKVLNALGFAFLLECSKIEEFVHDFANYADDIPSHYFSPSVSGIRHCTSRFCGKGRVPGSVEYSGKDIVKNSLGKVSLLQVVGYVITPRTFGARLRLTNDQLPLWGQDDTEDSSKSPVENPASNQFNQKQSARTQKSPRTGTKRYNEEPELPPMKKWISSGDIRCIPSLRWTQKNERTEGAPGSMLGRRAHVTLGVAKGTKPVQTGFDLLDVIECEDNMRRNGLVVQTYDVYNGCLRNFGEGRWMISLDKAILVNSIFTGEY